MTNKKSDMKKKQQNDQPIVTDVVAAGMLEGLGDEFKDSIYGLEFSSANVAQYVDTGSTLLNLIISNKMNGGIPVGRITSIAGGQSSGKSLLVAHILANAQKAGGVGVLIESENSSSKEFMTAVGVDIDNLIYVQMKTVEETFNLIEKLIARVRTKYPDKLLVICIDSMTALSTKNEDSEDYEQQGYGMEKAKLLSRAFRKITKDIGDMKVAFIFTNQLRQRVGATAFQDQFLIPGGQAILYYPSIIIRLNKIGQIKGKDGGIDRILGVNTKAKIEKNRLGPPFRTCTFPIYFDRGIDNNESILSELLDIKWIHKEKGAQLMYIDINEIADKTEEIAEIYTPDMIAEIFEAMSQCSGVTHEKRVSTSSDFCIKFKKSSWPNLLQDENFKKFIVQALGSRMQLKYMRQGIEDIRIESDSYEEGE